MTVEIAMATMIIDCPSCGRKLRVPDDLLGKAVKCPTCEHLFEAPLAPGQAMPSSVSSPAANPGFSPAPARSESAAPLGSEGLAASDQDADLQRCPSCGERNDPNAARCRVCGEELKPAESEADRPWEPTRAIPRRRDAEPHRGTLILVLGILSIVMVLLCGIVGLPLGIAAWVMGRRDLVKMRQNMMDREGEDLTQAGWICGIIGTVLDALWLLGCLVYIGIVITVASSMRRMPPPVPPPVPAPVRPAPMPAPGAPGEKAAVLLVTQHSITS
jgi:predicted Zn finger-like uncharacterized protein